MDYLRHLDTLSLEIGYGLIPLVDEKKEVLLRKRFKQLRQRVKYELGLVMPVVRITDNIQLKPSEYSLIINGDEAGRGTIKFGFYLAINPGGVTVEMTGEETKDPISGLPAHWVSYDNRKSARLAGYTVMDPHTIIITHLYTIIKLGKFSETNDKNEKNPAILPIFSRPGYFLYFGYPGSGIAKKLLDDAACLWWYGIKYTIVSCDEYHIDKYQHLRTMAEMLNLDIREYRGSAEALSKNLDRKRIKTALIYLRVFSFPKEFDMYDSLFHDQKFTKLLVLDCTRKDEINNALIAGIGKENIDAVILTKTDMILDEEKFFEYVKSIDLPVAGFSNTEILWHENVPWYKRELFYNRLNSVLWH
jgi:hypothetical protein